MIEVQGTSRYTTTHPFLLLLLLLGAMHPWRSRSGVVCLGVLASQFNVVGTLRWHGGLADPEVLVVALAGLAGRTAIACSTVAQSCKTQSSRGGNTATVSLHVSIMAKEQPCRERLTDEPVNRLLAHVVK